MFGLNGVPGSSPCKLPPSASGKLVDAGAGGGPISPRSLEAVREQGSPPAVLPSYPHSRAGRAGHTSPSPVEQGWRGMEGTAAVVGIDVSKDRLDVHIRPSGETYAVERTAAGLDALCRRLREIAPRIVALEATGGFEAIATAALAAACLPVAVVNPAQVRSFARALGRRAKTDPIDAAVIAHFAAATGVEARPLRDAATRLLGELVGRRRQITEMIRAEHNRAHRTTEPRLQKSIARLAEALERE